MATRPSRVPAGRTRPALRVVSGTSRGRRTTGPFAVVLILAVFAVGGLQAYLGQEGYKMSRVETQLKQAEQDYVLLRAEVATLSSPDRILKSAAELGLSPAAEPAFLPTPAGLPEPSKSNGTYEAKRLLGGLHPKAKE